MEDLSNYEKLRNDAKSFYDKVGGVYSPAFKDKIVFNSEGFNHLIFKNARNKRDKSSQILRFKLLPLAVKLIRDSTTYQEFEETIGEFDIKRHKKRVKESRSVNYWGIIAIIDNRKIKVIIRKIGDLGALHFWSIVPGWITNKYRDTKFYSTMKGDPGED